jgi:phospholipase D1/2
MKAKALWRASTILIPAVVMAALWHFGHLSRFTSADEAADALRAIAERPMGWALVPLGLAAGIVLFIPLAVLIAAVTLSFGPLAGFSFAFTGALLGAIAGYGVGRLFGASLFELLRGPKVDRAADHLRTHTFGALLAVRLMPLGSYSAVNLLAGSMRAPFAAYVLATALGVLPGIALLTLLHRVLDRPTPEAYALLAGGVVAFCVLLVAAGRWARRKVRTRPVS